jgi:DNA-directed RNA polymerase specialized sigma24 family protein
MVDEPSGEVLDLDEALTRLAPVDRELSRLVELRYFGGLTIEETCEVLGISPATLKREWATAPAWLSPRAVPMSPSRSNTLLGTAR